MINASQRIYNSYKKENSLYLAYGKYANVISKVVTLYVIINFVIYFLKFKTWNIIPLIIGGFIFILFIWLTNKRIIKRNNTLLNKYSTNKIGDKVEYLKLELLYKSINGERLFNEKGINYLINIYKSKIKKINFKSIGLVAIIVSAVVNNVAYVFLMGSKENFDRLSSYYKVIYDKSFLVLLGYIIIMILMFHFIVKKDLEEAFDQFKEFFYGGNYKALVDTLELVFMPAILGKQETGVIQLEDIFSSVLENKKPDHNNLKINKEYIKIKKKGAINKRKYNKVKKCILKSFKY